MKYKYSFIMPYYMRAVQLQRTLLSFAELYSRRKDFEVVLVVDNKDTEFSGVSTSQHLQVHRMDNPGQSPVRLYNYGARKAKGEYFVITNPECMHEDDILGELDNKLANNPNGYYVALCKYESGRTWQWKQHPEYAPSLLHFCACISRDNYNDVGGFDEEFADGYCFEDDAFRDSIRLAGIHIEHLDGAVYHQSHNMDWKRHTKRNELWHRNRKLWKTKYSDKL